MDLLLFVLPVLIAAAGYLAPAANQQPAMCPVRSPRK